MVLLLTLLSQIFLHEIPTVFDVPAVGVPAAGVPVACGAIGGVPAACLPGVWLLLTSPLYAVPALVGLLLSMTSLFCNLPCSCWRSYCCRHSYCFLQCNCVHTGVCVHAVASVTPVLENLLPLCYSICVFCSCWSSSWFFHFCCCRRLCCWWHSSCGRSLCCCRRLSCDPAIACVLDFQLTAIGPVHCICRFE